MSDRPAELPEPEAELRVWKTVASGIASFVPCGAGVAADGQECPSYGTNSSRHVCYWGGTYSRSPRSFVLPASMVIVLPARPAAPPRKPPLPCQTTTRHSPAGAFLISKLPCSSVTAKYGWLNTRIQPFIHGWILHSILTGKRSALRFLMDTWLLGGMRKFSPGLNSGWPV